MYHEVLQDTLGLSLLDEVYLLSVKTKTYQTK